MFRKSSPNFNSSREPPSSIHALLGTTYSRKEEKILNEHNPSISFVILRKFAAAILMQIPARRGAPFVSNDFKREINAGLNERKTF